MSVKTAKSVSVRNVNAIQEIEVPLVPGCVTSIRGANGAGKTTTMKAVLAACGGSTDGLEPRDGEESGQIEAPGISLRIGKRVSKKGASETFVVMEDGGELQRFIDPGVKDLEAADSRRIEAMLTMAGIQVESEAVAELIGGELWKQFESDCAPGKMKAVELVSALRRWLHKRAQAAEVDKNRAEGELVALPEAKGEPVVQDVDQLLRKVQECQTAVDRAAAAREAAVRADEMLATLQPVNIRILEEEWRTEASTVERLRDEIESMKANMSAAESTLERQLSRKLMADSRLQDAKLQAEKVETLRAQQAARVTAHDVEALGAALSSAKEQHQTAVVDNQWAKDHQATVQKRKEAQDRLAEHTARAGKLRDLASQAPELLQACVGKVDGFSVNEEMRLCCEHRRGVIPFAELSPGEQAVRAIQVSTGIRQKPVGRIGVVAIPQPVWESLDDENRAIVQQFAGTEQIAILIAEASHGSTSRDLSVSVSP